MFTKSALTLAASLCVLSTASALAQRSTPVTVQNTGDNPIAIEGEVSLAASSPLEVTSTVRRIPVTCKDVLLSQALPTSSVERSVTCHRRDTDGSFTTVPGGFRFEVTDVIVYPNAVYGRGYYRVLFGPGDATPFPDEPNAVVSGELMTSQSVYSTHAPFTVIRAGQAMTAVNLAFDFTSSSSGTVNADSVNVDFRGFLVAENDIGKN